MTPAADVSVPTANVARLTRANLDASARGHRLQRAVVRRVEAGRALLEILVSRNVRSGFAEAALPPQGVAPGSTVVIDVVGQEGGRALARVVGPA